MYLRNHNPRTPLPDASMNAQVNTRVNTTPLTLTEFVNIAYDRADPAHDAVHAWKVLDNAREIACNMTLSPEEDAIFDWVMAGHDAGDHKRPIADRLSDEELTKIYTDRFGPELAEAIVEIHQNCSWSKRLTRKTVKYETLMKILQDADWIEAIGAIGLQRCIDFTTCMMPGATSAEISAAVCKHIREKLLLIPTELNFDQSREIADVQPLLIFLADNEVIGQ